MNQNEEQVHLAKTNSNGGERDFFSFSFIGELYHFVFSFCYLLLVSPLQIFIYLFLEILLILHVLFLASVFLWA